MVKYNSTLHDGFVGRVKMHVSKGLLQFGVMLLQETLAVAQS